MPISITISLHVLAAVVWVGGMFFAYIALRPAAANVLEPALRLTLWGQVFKRFFPWVWMAVVFLLATGLWITFVDFGGITLVDIHVHIMIALGVIMMLIFAHVYYGPYKRLIEAITIEDWQTGAAKLNQIRQLIKINLILGLIVVVIAAGGRYL